MLVSSLWSWTTWLSLSVTNRSAFQVMRHTDGTCVCKRAARMGLDLKKKAFCKGTPPSPGSFLVVLLRHAKTIQNSKISSKAFKLSAIRSKLPHPQSLYRHGVGAWSTTRRMFFGIRDSYVCLGFCNDQRVHIDIRLRSFNAAGNERHKRPKKKASDMSLPWPSCMIGAQSRPLIWPFKSSACRVCSHSPPGLGGRAIASLWSHAMRRVDRRAGLKRLHRCCRRVPWRVMRHLLWRRWRWRWRCKVSGHGWAMAAGCIRIRQIRTPATFTSTFAQLVLLHGALGRRHMLCLLHGPVWLSSGAPLRSPSNLDLLGLLRRQVWHLWLWHFSDDLRLHRSHHFLRDQL